ncbi:MAG: hypothetical protein A3J47_03785 [Candidatus Yanofskybacteria bacterium RIFCSPHIGHO2_02_FULL_43_22]|uniref:Uncharacterized protein n=1 Tax=Candidatus Yanofskybacteria bacterium RIFCSPHIGHO2_02_FULL_43_22 TaxID=1802681 RepID=A0A1F8FL53_9BACT|nr:MAG: hypothetical protein A3J47_03785 [Candidatus Yanofskybacteria bacterium RIFCSPHIGHO2_02_FULL_43_22]
MIKPWSLGYEKTKTKAQKIYKKIGIVPCPALNGELVHFSRFGFDHIITAKGRKLRTRKEQKRRFRLLQYAEQIVKNPKALLRYREQEVKHTVNRHGQKLLITGTGKFWTFLETIKNTKVKLVVGQIENGIKQFISIMQ